METARTLKERLFLPGVLVVFLRMASFSTVTSAGKIDHKDKTHKSSAVSSGGMTLHGQDELQHLRNAGTL